MLDLNKAYRFTAPQIDPIIRGKFKKYAVINAIIPHYNQLIFSDNMLLDINKPTSYIYYKKVGQWESVYDQYKDEHLAFLGHTVYSKDVFLLADNSSISYDKYRKKLQNVYFYLNGQAEVPISIQFILPYKPTRWELLATPYVSYINDDDCLAYCGIAHYDIRRKYNLNDELLPHILLDVDDTPIKYEIVKIYKYRR